MTHWGKGGGRLGPWPAHMQQPLIGALPSLLNLSMACPPPPEHGGGVRGGGGGTPRFWTPTTPPTNCWPEATWGGGGSGGGVQGGANGGRLGGAWGGGAPGGSVGGGGVGLVWISACAKGGDPRPVCPYLTGSTGYPPWLSGLTAAQTADDPRTSSRR